MKYFFHVEVLRKKDLTLLTVCQLNCEQHNDIMGNCVRKLLILALLIHLSLGNGVQVAVKNTFHGESGRKMHCDSQMFNFGA